jgi:hypothetical protein
MAANDQDTYIPVGVTPDEASFTKLDQKVAASMAQIHAMSQANIEVAGSADKAGRSLKDAFEVSRKSIDDDTQSVNKLRTSLKDAASDADTLQQKSAGGSGIGSSTLRSTGRALDQLGLSSVGRPIQQIGDLQLIAKEAAELGKSFEGLPGILGEVAGEGAAVAGSFGAVVAVAGPLALAAGAVAVAFKLVNDSASDSEKAVQRALGTQKGYYEAVATLTTAQAEKQVDVLKRQAAAQQQATDETERALKSLEQQTGINRNVGIAAPGALGDGFRDLTKQLDDNKKAVDDTNSSIGRFTGGLASGAFAANDMLDAEQKLADLRKKESAAQLALFDKQAQDQIEMSRLQREGTSKQIQSVIDGNNDRIDALNTETEAIMRSGDTSDEASKKLGDLIGEINRLSAQNEDLTKNLLPARKAQEDYTESLKEFAKDLLALDEVNKKVKAGLADLKTKYDDQTDQTNAKRKLQSERDEADYSRKRLNEVTGNAKKLAAEDVDYYSARSKKIRDFSLAQQQTEDKANTERLKDIHDYGEAQRQAAIDYANQVAEIEAKSKDNRINDAAHLDARALDQELRNRKQQLDSASKNYSTEQAKKKEALDKQLADLAENTQAEEQQRAQAFQRQLSDEDEQYQTKRSREIADFNAQLAREDNERRIAIQRQLENFRLEDMARKTAYDQQVQNLKNQLLKPMEKLQADSFQTQIKAFKSQVDSQIQTASHAWSLFMAGLRPVGTTTYTPQNFQTAKQQTDSLGRKLGVPGYKDGGDPPLYTPVKVGERGPETAVFTSPAHIYPSGAAAAGGSTVNFTFTARSI